MKIVEVRKKDEPEWTEKMKIFTWADSLKASIASSSRSLFQPIVGSECLVLREEVATGKAGPVGAACASSPPVILLPPMVAAVRGVGGGEVPASALAWVASSWSRETEARAKEIGMASGAPYED